MNGPAHTYGPRFSGGYQFPRTNAASYSREQPVRLERLGDGAYVQIVPLRGSHGRVMYDVYGSWRKRSDDGQLTIVSSSTIARDRLEASIEFQRLVREITRG